MTTVIQLHLNTDPAISLDAYRLLTQVQHERRKRELAEHAAIQAQIYVTAMRDTAVGQMLLAWSAAMPTPPTDPEWAAKRKQLFDLLNHEARDAVRKDQAR